MFCTHEDASFFGMFSQFACVEVLCLALKWLCHNWCVTVLSLNQCYFTVMYILLQILFIFELAFIFHTFSFN